MALHYTITTSHHSKTYISQCIKCISVNVKIQINAIKIKMRFILGGERRGKKKKKHFKGGNTAWGGFKH